MKTVRHRDTNRYGVALDGAKKFDHLYLDIFHSVKHGTGTYQAPHLKLLLDCVDIVDEVDSVAVMFFSETEMIIERFSHEELDSKFEDIENKTNYEWNAILKPSHAVKHWYYEDRVLDLLEFWLSLMWDKRELGK